jgi:O-antigen/teichoic acid export membrane protein
MGAHRAGIALSEPRRRRVAIVHLFGSAVVDQALLSAASFGVGLLLIRGTSDDQYGYYVLATSAVLLLVSLQNALFAPALASRIVRLDGAGRANLVGGLYRAQLRLMLALGLPLASVALVFWYSQRLDAQTGPVVLAAVVAAIAALYREYFRLVLLTHRRPTDILRADLGYVAMLVTGAFIATRTATPAFAAILSIGLAAAAGGAMLARRLWRFEAWNPQASMALVREIAPLAAWSTTGAASHWAFSQGYIYLVAATLDVAAVTALAATRLLLIPVNLLSSGIGSLMLPLAAGWLHRDGAIPLLRRLGLSALALAVAALGYFALLWRARDWLFDVVLNKQFVQRDELLLLWGIVMLVVVMRNQLAYLPAARGQFRDLTLLTLICAAVALAISFAAMRQVGVTGALYGMLAGELINAIGIIILCRRPDPLKAEGPPSAPAAA